MAEFNFSLTDGNPDELAKLNKTLNWLMNNLDHDNITRIYTEYCNIQSENGETVIDGPLVTMNAGTTTIRLKMGYDANSPGFLFSLYDLNGLETIRLDSTGRIEILDNLTIKQASVAHASITIGNGLGGVTPATITYSGQDVPLSDVQLTLNSVSNIRLVGSGVGYIALDAGAVDVFGPLYVDRIEGYSTNYVIHFGTGNCGVNVFGGDLRMNNNNGAYLIITDVGLTYYDSAGTPHVIV